MSAKYEVTLVASLHLLIDERSVSRGFTSFA